MNDHVQVPQRIIVVPSRYAEGVRYRSPGSRAMRAHPGVVSGNNSHPKRGSIIVTMTDLPNGNQCVWNPGWGSRDHELRSPRVRSRCSRPWALISNAVGVIGNRNATSPTTLTINVPVAQLRCLELGVSQVRCCNLGLGRTKFGSQSGLQKGEIRSCLRD